jgi:hypothetical protein
VAQGAGPEFKTQYQINKTIPGVVLKPVILATWEAEFGRIII